MKSFPTLDDINVANKRVIVRMDLNVPMVGGRVSDNTRIVRLLPTLHELIKKKAKIIILSHLGRPKGEYIPNLSLAPLVDALSAVLPKTTIKFGVDCIGEEAEDATHKLKSGEILLLENLRFHPGEESNDPKFAKALAALGDIYVNDAFSSAHRAHASVVGITKHLPFAAGRLMEDELNNIETFISKAERPFTAIVGGAKVSTKLELLDSLIDKVDNLIIGGAMANTFLYAQGISVGKSLCEENLKSTALKILASAKKKNCTIHLPIDVIVAEDFAARASNAVMDVKNIPKNGMVLDVGPDTLAHFSDCIKQSKTLLWNGPLGAFETTPFDVSTIGLGRVAASLTASGKLKSIAGGGDTVAAMTCCGLAEQFSYLSTAGGAFLEWMEGKALPGVAVLTK